MFGQERGYKKKLLAPTRFHGAKQGARAKACNSVEFVDLLVFMYEVETDFQKGCGVVFLTTVDHFKESVVMLWIDIVLFNTKIKQKVI